MSIRVVIIEDEELSAIKLQHLLLQMDEDIWVVQIIDSVKKSIEYLSENQDIDLIFLDIQLNDGSGMDILEKLNINIPIIFTTAYSEFALDAFKHTSVDYLLKPIGKKDVTQSIQKFKRIFKEQEHSLPSETIPNSLSRNSRILGIRGKSKYPILLDEIAYFFIEDRIVWLVRDDGSKYYLNKTLDEVESSLNPPHFFRANRKVIIAIPAILKMEQLPKSRLKLIVKPKPHFDIIVSSENASKFKDWLTQ